MCSTNPRLLAYLQCFCFCCPGGTGESYPSRQSSSGSASKRQFPSSATLFTGEPLRGVSATPSAFDQPEPASATVPTVTTYTGRFNTYSPGNIVSWLSQHGSSRVKFLMEIHLTTTRGRLSYGITQYYLPPDTTNIPSPKPQPVKAGTRFTYPGRMEGWVNLVTYWDGLPTHGQSPIQVLTWPGIE